MNTFSENELKKWCTVKYVTSFDGEKLYTQCYQKTQNPTATHIILHGLGGNSQSSLLLVNEILARFPNHQVVTYDERGHGYSTKIFTSHKFSQIDQFGSADLDAIIQQYQPQRLTLWGHSVGSFIIQNYLQLDKHQSCHQVFLLNSAIHTPNTLLPRHSFFRLFVLSSQIIKLSSSKQSSFATGLKFAKTHDISVQRVLQQDMVNTCVWRFPLLFLSVKGWKNKQLNTIDQQNVFFVGGRKDIIISYKSQLRQKEKLQKAHTLVFNCNHHQMFFTHYKELVELITPD